MTSPDRLDAAGAVRAFATATGESFTLVRRLAGGETGAHQVRGPDGSDHVLKWEPDPSARAARTEAVGLTRMLGDLGWPVPEQRLVDTPRLLFVLQRYLPGAPVTRVTGRLTDEMLALHDRRIGRARAGAGTWPDHLVETLTVGGAGYCMHQPLRDHDDRTARLVARIEAIGRDVDPVELAATDIVHWDLHPGNVLTEHGALRAIVDNDFVTVGDARFDLVTLALAVQMVPADDDVRAQLWAAAFDGLTAPRRDAYVGHVLLRFLDWAIRKGRTAEVDHWLTQANRLLG